MTTKTIVQTPAVSETTLAVAGAVFAGVLLVFAAGFAQASVFHDAAHDQRHAIAFPCH